MKIVVVEEQLLFREGLQSLFESNGSAVAGTAADGTEALEKVRLLDPEVILSIKTRGG